MRNKNIKWINFTLLFELVEDVEKIMKIQTEANDSMKLLANCPIGNLPSYSISYNLKFYSNRFSLEFSLYN